MTLTALIGFWLRCEHAGSRSVCVAGAPRRINTPGERRLFVRRRPLVQPLVPLCDQKGGEVILDLFVPLKIPPRRLRLKPAGILELHSKVAPVLKVGSGTLASSIRQRFHSRQRHFSISRWSFPHGAVPSLPSNGRRSADTTSHTR